MHRSSTDLPAALMRTIYRFGSFQSALFGYMTFRKDGIIGCYSHPNESRFAFEDNHILLRTVEGRTTSRLKYHENINAFFSDDDRDMYIYPLLTLDPPSNFLEDRLPVVVNSIPKSGTYLLELVFKQLNYKATGLHMSGLFFDDNRYTPTSEIHKSPQARRRPCPASALTSIMQPGEIAIGHIDSVDQLIHIGSQRCLLINLIRDLRSVLYSLYRFKMEVVEAVDPPDLLWRKIDEPGRFMAFLVNNYTSDVAYIKTVTDAMLRTGGAVFIRYEQLIKSEAHASILADLANRVGPGQAEAIVRQIPKAVGESTSTLSKSWGAKTLGYRSLWNDDAERFFEASGLRDLNNRLGYE